METKPIFHTMHSADGSLNFPNDDALPQNLPILMNIKKEIPDTEHENDNLINQAYNLVNIKTDPDSIESGQYNNIVIFSESSLSKIYDAKDSVKLDLNNLSTAIIKHESVDIKVEPHDSDLTPMTTDLETSLISIKDESFGRLGNFEDASCDENLAESRNIFYHVCKICNKKFLHKGNLKYHEQRVHLKIKQAKCTYCDKSFTHMGHLKNHEKTVHLKIREWKCNFCDKYFTAKGSLKVHEQTVHLKIRNWKCDLCDKSFTQMVHLKNHEKSVHLKIREWKCNFCDKYFTAKRSLKVHEQTVHLKVRDWKCNLCNKSFTQMAHLKNHEKRVHLKIRDWKCELCDKYFTVKSSLKLHEKTVHLKIREWKCNFCDKYFAEKCNLKKHEKSVHLKIRDWKCNICNKTFSNKSNLKSHSIVHVSNFSEVCDICNKTFRHLRAHKYRAHCKPLIQNFNCAHCDKVFLKKSNLKKHLMVHSDVRD